jgi:selenocysteine lyase/cysteine desulfurase
MPDDIAPAHEPGADHALHLLDDAAFAFERPAGHLYLDAAAQGPRLHRVLAAGHRALQASTSPWRMSLAAWETQIETLRSRAADTLFQGDGEGLAMVPSAAHALATAARNLPLQRGDRALVLEGEFPSNLLPWQQRCSEVGAQVIGVVRVDGQAWSDAVMAALQAQPRVRIVALPQAHWHDGALLDLDRIAPQVHAMGAALVLDLSQSLGAVPLALDRWRPDFVASVGHKWLLGPPGLAWLWAAPHWRGQGVPIEQHWQARDAGDQWRFPVDDPPRYRAGARRFDAGGVTDALRLAMADAAMAQLQAWSVESVSERLQRLTGALDQALDERGLSQWKTAGHAPHFTALRAPTPALLEAVATRLGTEGIVCTRRAGLLRIAPHLHVHEADMRRVAESVALASA